MQFQGYPRQDGRIGVRNTVLVMAVCDCGEPAARQMAEGIPGAVSVTHYHGCIALEVVPTIVGVCINPNIHGVVLVVMGCEGQRPEPIAEEIAKSGKPVEIVNIQEIGNTRKAIARGRAIVTAMAQQAAAERRVAVDISRLAVGVKCGGSDTSSGIAANPAIGVMSDMMVDAGARVVMIEPIEAIGAEDELARRAINETVRQDVLRWVGDEEKRWSVPGASIDFMCGGNVLGGLTTLEEKSLGAVHKSGHRPISGVLKVRPNYLQQVPEAAGFYLQEGIHIELQAMTYQAAAGVNIIVFATGRGGSFGHAICPLVKVTGHPETWKKMSEDMDVNASTIMEGVESIESVGKRIFDEVLAVASGKITRGEELGFYNFNIWKQDPRLEALLGLNKE
ncbi:MAG: UxaA family hydrolase [Dehalococcoidia bacterium]|nr:UxaA family hydrolase [Dehalococcoidia bacterium]